MKHGLAAAKHFLLPGEDSAEFVEFRETLFDELDPSTPLEAEYVKHIVTLLWRLRRIPEFEAALMAYHHLFLRRRRDELSPMFPERVIPEVGEEAPRLALGEVVNEVLRLGYTDKLSRYETSLRAQLSKGLQELKALQQDRVSDPSERHPCLDGAPEGHLLSDQSSKTD